MTFHKYFVDWLGNYINASLRLFEPAWHIPLNAGNRFWGSCFVAEKTH